MDLSGIPAICRIAGGVAFMTLGYSSVLWDMNCAVNSSVSANMCQNQTSAPLSELIFRNMPVFPEVNQPLSHELLSNSILCSSLVPGNNSKQVITEVNNVCTTHTIAKGVFAGAKAVKSKISSNFYVDSRRLGVPAGVVDTVIRTLSSKIDFRRALKKGSSFEIIFDKHKGLLYSRITTTKANVAVYAVYTNSKKEYFLENGTKAIQARGNNKFGQPLSGRLQVSSGFGMRLHPVYRQYKFHTGVDFKANHGAPVMAICDGVVTRASNYAGYGKCVDVRHASGYTSRYAHLSNCKVHVGTHVRKGAVIGNVGSTGVSTGSHLHLELAKNNQHLNPLSVKMIPPVCETVRDNRAFNAMKSYVKHVMSTIR